MTRSQEKLLIAALAGLVIAAAAILVVTPDFATDIGPGHNDAFSAIAPLDMSNF